MRVDTEKAMKIIDMHGVNHQRVKAAEELSELLTLLLQDANCNGKVALNRIAEEIADVYVMLKQTELIYLLDDRDIQPIIDGKLDRTLNRRKTWDEEVAKAREE